MRQTWTLIFALLTPSLLADAPPQAKLQLRLEKEGWGEAPLENVQAVFQSAGAQLLPHFPDLKLDPIQVSPRGGPITLFRRGENNQYIVKLATTDTFWAQYAFQFSHELAHILCRYDENNTGQLWLEESLCELASLYTLRAMSTRWKTAPPYRNWKEYARHLADYAQKRIDAHPLPEGKTLAQWYADNAPALEKNATDRARNTTVAAALLPIFEKRPEGWAAIYYLNQNKPKEKQTLPQRLANWHEQTPKDLRWFPSAIATELGIKLDR